jgi:hypothetical protein
MTESNASTHDEHGSNQGTNFEALLDALAKRLTQ